MEDLGGARDAVREHGDLVLSFSWPSSLWFSSQPFSLSSSSALLVAHGWVWAQAERTTAMARQGRRCTGRCDGLTRALSGPIWTGHVSGSALVWLCYRFGDLKFGFI
ncbi:hypothetical protein M0R45_016130 [Rubus argutus]|uniref:Uncharacterized protein n=1 Tax=Rubus argutus TaxID=59490 RepID=A0AAW1XU12_RUBAR